MKTTLENSYCRPTTEAEWRMFKLSKSTLGGIMDAVVFEFGKPISITDSILFNNNKTEIPVQHFIDLVEDRICAWRLEEIGFTNKHDSDYVYAIDVRTDLYITPNYNFIRGRYNGDEVDIPINTQTFTDLQTLIRFLK